MEESPRKRRKLDVECLFSDLESKFLEIDIKIKAKKHIVNIKHDTDAEKICNIFEEEIDERSKDEEGIIEQHEHLLNKLCQKRDDHLQEITKNFQNFAENLTLINIFNAEQYDAELEYATEALMEKYAKIKENFFHFAPLRRKNYASMLKKYVFSKPLDLEKLNKYFNLVIVSRSYILLPENHFFISSHHILPSKRVVVFARSYKSSPGLRELLIINENGILHSRTLHNQSRLGEFSIKVSSTAILVYFHYFENIKGINSGESEEPFVNIYDFELNLIKSFKLDFNYTLEFITPNNQAVFRNSESNKIFIYDLDYFKTTYINTQCYVMNEPFFVEANDKLVHMNEEFLYFNRTNEIKMFDYIYIMSRNTGLKVKGIQLKRSRESFAYFSNTIIFDNESNIYDWDRYQNVLFSYNSRCSILGRIEFSDNIRKDCNIKFSNYDTVILNNRIFNQHFEISGDSSYSDVEDQDYDTQVKFLEY
jgi:hypothetical protein